MNKLKENKAITLIALVITIIVLLILTGVAINSIMGQDGSPEKAAQAKIENDKGAARDAATMLVAEKIQDYYEEKYVKSNPEDKYKGTKLAYLESKLSSSANVTRDGYTIVVSGGAITATKTGESTAFVEGKVSPEGVISWNDSNVGGGSGSGSGSGTELTAEQKAALAATINGKIGNEVSYRLASNYTGTWQVFYSDAEAGEVFIIPTMITETSTAINGHDSEYAGSASFVANPVADATQDLTYGVRYNGDWLAECTTANENPNAKTVAYLCDKKQWTRYASGTFGGTTAAPSGTYAVGGPTMELLVASIKAKIGTDYSSAVTVNSTGYGNGSITGLVQPYKAKYNSSSYGYWWLASPSGSGVKIMFNVNNSGKVKDASYSNSSFITGVRPLVSIPMSSFQTSWISE